MSDSLAILIFALLFKVLLVVAIALGSVALLWYILWLCFLRHVPVIKEMFAIDDPPQKKNGDDHDKTK